MMFDRISKDWSCKRTVPWDILADFLHSVSANWLKANHTQDEPQPLLFLDIGSGSGRNGPLLLDYCQKLIELDESREMLRQNGNTSLKIQADMHSLPFRDHIFDGIFSVAALHHIKGQTARVQTIQEMKRIGRKKGVILITVWRFFQTRFKQEFKKQLTHFSFQPSREINNKNNNFPSNISPISEIGDIMVPWTLSDAQKKESILRFYHLFRAGEFRALMRIFTPITFRAMGKKGAKDNFFFLGQI